MDHKSYTFYVTKPVALQQQLHVHREPRKEY